MMRCHYVIKYFNYVPRKRTFQKIATLEVPMRERFVTPKHGHIALTSKADEMAVMFNSASTETPRVRYGLSAASLNRIEEGTSKTYAASDMCVCSPRSK